MNMPQIRVFSYVTYEWEGPYTVIGIGTGSECTATGGVHKIFPVFIYSDDGVTIKTIRVDDEYKVKLTNPLEEALK